MSVLNMEAEEDIATQSRESPTGDANTARGRNAMAAQANVRQVVKVTVNLPVAVYAALMSLAESRGVTMTEALRHAISTEKFLDDAMAKGDQVLLKNEKEPNVREVVFHR